MNTSGPKHPVVRIIHALLMVMTMALLGTVVFCLVATCGLYGFLPDSVVNAVNLTLPWAMLLGSAWASAVSP